LGAVRPAERLDGPSALPRLHQLITCLRLLPCHYLGALNQPTARPNAQQAPRERHPVWPSKLQTRSKRLQAIEGERRAPEASGVSGPEPPALETRDTAFGIGPAALKDRTRGLAQQ
jgi:hypothetical protein